MPEAHSGNNRPDMRFPIKPVLLFFAALVPVYLLVYWGIESTRRASKPWELGFIVDSNRVPSLRIRQPNLGIGDVLIRFPDERLTNAPSETIVILDRPQPPIPFGTRISQDLTFLPGVETLELMGHEIEIAPRTLVLNRKETPWSSNAVFELRSSDKLPPEQLVKKKRFGQ
ncbi:MAG: hypothetical protein FJ405_14520 [Verrucomicrobia bacterium]|nr:hypothetical protein [Verrucomicrobiota bacterium]